MWVWKAVESARLIGRSQGRQALAATLAACTQGPIGGLKIALAWAALELRGTILSGAMQRALAYWKPRDTSCGVLCCKPSGGATWAKREQGRSSKAYSKVPMWMSAAEF